MVTATEYSTVQIGPGTISPPPFTTCNASDLSTCANWQTVSIGQTAGTNNTGYGVINIGPLSGRANAAMDAVNIGREAGEQNAGVNSVNIALRAGESSTGPDSINIGRQAGQYNSGTRSISIGYVAGQNNTGMHCAHIGQQAGQTNTYDYCYTHGLQSSCNGPNQFTIGSSLFPMSIRTPSNSVTWCMGASSDTCQSRGAANRWTGPAGVDWYTDAGHFCGGPGCAAMSATNVGIYDSAIRVVRAFTPGTGISGSITDGVLTVSASGGSGTVTSVNGTTDQICVATGTTTPVLSICPAFSWSGTTYAASTSTSWGSSSSSGPDGTQVYLLPDNGKLSWTDNVNFGVEATVTVKRQLSGTDGEIEILASGLSGERTSLEVRPSGAALQWQSIPGTSTTAEPNVRTAVTVSDGQLQLVCNDGGAGDDGIVTLTPDELTSSVPIYAPLRVSTPLGSTPSLTGFTSVAGTGPGSSTCVGTREVMTCVFTTGTSPADPGGNQGTLLVKVTGLGPYPNRVICSLAPTTPQDGIYVYPLQNTGSSTEIEIRAATTIPGTTLAASTAFGFTLLCSGY